MEDMKLTKTNLKQDIKKISYKGNNEFEITSLHQSPKLFTKVLRPNTALPNNTKNSLITNNQNQTNQINRPNPFLVKNHKVYENDKKSVKDKLSKYKRLLISEFDQSKYIDIEKVHDKNEMDFYKLKNLEGIIKEVKRPQTVVKKMFNRSEIKNLENAFSCNANKNENERNNLISGIISLNSNNKYINNTDAKEKKSMFLDVNNNISKKVYERATSACLLPTHKTLGSFSKFIDISNQEYLKKHKELIDFKTTEIRHVKKIKADSLESDIFFQKNESFHKNDNRQLPEKENIILMDEYTHSKKGAEHLNHVKKEFNPSYRSDNDWIEKKNDKSLMNSYSTNYNPLNSLVKINTVCRVDSMNDPFIANRKKGIMEIHDLNRTFAPNWNQKFYENHTKDKNLFNKSKNLCNEYYDLYNKYKNLADKPFKKKLI